MTLTDWIIAGSCLAFLVVDVALAVRGELTITQALQRASMRRPVVPFAAGFVAGHIFGQF